MGQAQPTPPPSPPDRETWHYGLRLALQLLTAHHPLCDQFQSDHYRLFGRKWCRGCVAAVPTFLLGAVLALLLLIHGSLHPYTVGAIGLLFGVPHGTTYLHRFPAPYRAFAKITGGLGLGLLIIGILLAPHGMALRFTLLTLLGIAFLLLQSWRMKRMLAVCDACPWRRDWARCPGFHA